MSDRAQGRDGHRNAQADLRTWVRTWERAGRELEEQRRARLAAMTLEDMRRQIRIVFSAPIPRPPRSWSGLVEMERLFSRLR